jgi:hypothetical protein
MLFVGCLAKHFKGTITNTQIYCKHISLHVILLNVEKKYKLFFSPAKTQELQTLVEV